MGAKTKISWTAATWNPMRGCTRISEGCRHCYAETLAARFSGPGQPYEGLAQLTPSGPRWTGEVRLIEEHLLDPLRWRKPRRVFVNSMSDLFHEKLIASQIDRIFAVMKLADRHTFQVLTKRPVRMWEYVTYLSHVRPDLSQLPNVHLGVSVEDQRTADERIPILLQTPAALRWVSAEPLQGPVRFADEWLAGLGWIVIGGESGSGHRPMEVAWAEDLARQCQAAGVPVFVKQDSGPRPGQQGRLPDWLWALKEYPR